MIVLSMGFAICLFLALQYGLFAVTANNVRFEKHKMKNTRIPHIKTASQKKMHVRYIEKTNIRRFIPFAGLHHLIVLILAILVISFYVCMQHTSSMIASMILSLFICLTPIVILEMVVNYNMEKTRKDLASFIAMLSRWCSVKNDIFFAFDKVSQSKLNEPLKSFIKDLNTQIQYGLHPIDALDFLALRIDDTESIDAIVNIKQSIRFRGDMHVLLSNMESRLYRMQEEYTKRRISTFSDRIIILFVMSVTLWMAGLFLIQNNTMAAFYFSTPLGLGMLTLFCAVFGAGVIVFIHVTKMKE